MKVFENTSRSNQPRDAAPVGQSPWRAAAWVMAALLTGFGLAWVGGELVSTGRRLFVLLHLGVTGSLLALYFHQAGWRWTSLLRRWPIGLISGGLAGILLVVFLLSEPPSRGPAGFARAFDLAWLGLVYGALDAGLLTLLPASAVLAAWKHSGWPADWAAGSALALLASAAVTVAYHSGFPEFRGPQMAGPVIGNVIVTISYLAGRSPLAPLLAHWALHMSTVLHAYSTGAPLPPH